MLTVTCYPLEPGETVANLLELVSEGKSQCWWGSSGWEGPCVRRQEACLLLSG